MITAIKLSNNKMQVVTGGSATCTYETSFENDCVINGVVVNESDFKRQISAFWAANTLPKKDVALVINSSQMVLKKVSVPTEKDAKMSEMIAMEFPEADKTEPQLYDYAVLTEDKQTNFSEVLSVMSPISLIESYVNIFNDMGITLTSVIPVQMSAVNKLSSLPSMQSETAIIQLFDETTLISLLWVEGKYTYAQRTRLFSEQNSDEFTSEITQNISSMLQFYSTLRKEHSLENVYICGLKDEALAKCTDAIQQLGLKSAYFVNDNSNNSLEQTIPLNDTIETTGAFIKAKHNVNLLERYKKQRHNSSEKNKILGKFLPLVITVGVFLVVFAALLITNIVMNARLAKQKEYLDDPNNISQAAEAENVIEENNALRLTISALKSASEAQQSYPRINSIVISAIEQAGGGAVSMEITSYYSETGQLTLAAQTSGVDQINSYIDRLKATNLFDNVEYSGYTYTQNTNTYTINVVCYLNTGAGK